MICLSMLKRLGDVKNLGSHWWQKLRNLVCNPNFYRLLSRKTKVIVVEIVPFVGGQFQVLAQDGLGSLVVKGCGLGQGFEHIRSDARGITLGSMNHESRVFAGIAGLCSQVRYDSDGRDSAAVINRELNRQSLEVVVQRYPVANKAPGRLEK